MRSHGPPLRPRLLSHSTAACTRDAPLESPTSDKPREACETLDTKTFPINPLHCHLHPICTVGTFLTSADGCVVADGFTVLSSPAFFTKLQRKLRALSFLTSVDGCDVANRVHLHSSVAFSREFRRKLHTLACFASADGFALTHCVGPSMILPHGFQESRQTLLKRARPFQRLCRTH